MISSVKRWGPVVASVVLAGAELLETFGEREAAEALRASVVSVSAAGVALVGVGLKVWSQIQKWRESRDRVSGR